MNKKTAFIYDESYFRHNAGEGALFEPPSEYIENFGSVAESPQSKRRIKNLIEKSGLMEQLVQIKPQTATEEQLAYFHTKTHIENVKKLSESQGGFCGDSAYVGTGSYEIAKLSAGGAITAVKTVVTDDTINSAYVLTRPPGHHAMANEGMGFCIFNNAVIAAKYAQKELGIKKILILDWDAHHGNGIEDAFYDDDSVLYISLHQEGLEPMDRGNINDKGIGKGEGFTINIPLPAGCGDAVYEYAFRQSVVPAVQNFAPELIIVSAGQDANIFDPLARMMVSADGYRMMTKLIKELANQHANGRLVCLHEGGYCPVYVPFCTLAIIEELSGITTKAKDPFIYAMAGTKYDKLSDYQKQRVDEIKLAIFDFHF
jgi:acetoin utilization deacetylase AcuC-like enzyme